jgi:hypothetical protein
VRRRLIRASSRRPGARTARSEPTSTGTDPAAPTATTSSRLPSCPRASRQAVSADLRSPRPGD